MCLPRVQWCVFLQERVVSEIFYIAMSERNQQVLCQVSALQQVLSTLQYSTVLVQQVRTIGSSKNWGGRLHEDGRLLGRIRY